MKQNSGWAVREGGATTGAPGGNVRPTCSLPSCTLPVFVEEDGRIHDYCGQTHDREAGAIASLDEDVSDDEAGVDPDHCDVRSEVSFYGDAGPPTTQVSRLLGNSEFRDYMDDLRKSDKDRDVLVEDLLAMHEELQVILTDARDARQAAIPVSRLGPIRQAQRRPPRRRREESA